MATEIGKYAGPKLADMEVSLKLPSPKVYQLPTGLDQLYEGLENVGVGPRYFGHVRKGEWHLELGGPKVGYSGFYFVDICDDPEDVTDGKVTVYGPDINEIPPESSIPFGLHWKVYGKDITHMHYEYLARIGGAVGILYLEGWMLTGAPTEPWLRLSKKAAPKFTWAKLAQAVRGYAMTSIPLIEKFEAVITVATPEVGGPEVIKQLVEKIDKRREIYDAWSTTMEDADVDTFYGCTICQAIAPNHACVITPSLIPFCGIMSFMGAKTNYEVDPTGYIFPISRGEILDPELGWYTGVDDEMYRRSHEHYKHFHLNSSITYPSTNCGCFEAASFYIPEVDGIGLCQRRYTGFLPLGIRFSTLAGFMSGGEQNHGFKGCSLRSIMMKDFLRGDGGWNRIVWIPKDVKLEIAEAIPEEVYDKIATEEDCIEPSDLKEFLRQKKHPIVEKFWKNGEPQPITVPAPGDSWPEDEQGRIILGEGRVVGRWES